MFTPEPHPGTGARPHSGPFIAFEADIRATCPVSPLVPLRDFSPCPQVQGKGRTCSVLLMGGRLLDSMENGIPTPSGQGPKPHCQRVCPMTSREMPGGQPLPGAGVPDSASRCSCACEASVLAAPPGLAFVHRGLADPDHPPSLDRYCPRIRASLGHHHPRFGAKGDGW